MKKVLMVHHADGTEQFVCKVCNQPLRHCDSYSMSFSGEVEEVGDEYLYCDTCGTRMEYPKMPVGELPEVRF